MSAFVHSSISEISSLSQNFASWQVNLTYKNRPKSCRLKSSSDQRADTVVIKASFGVGKLHYGTKPSLRNVIRQEIPGDFQ